MAAEMLTLLYCLKKKDDVIIEDDFGFIRSTNAEKCMASFTILPHIAEADIDPTSTDSQYERTPPPPWEQHNIVSLIHRYQSIMPQERSDE